jgi:hypothetical protein
MNINRHNYEELFLLYVDNELTAAQRMIVEAFVTSNPDLKEEFNLIQQSTFRSNDILDQGFKTSLLKPVTEESGITEEQLLLYVDDELNRNEKDTVEKVVAVNESLQKELHWLQQSKLQADETIVFPDKSILYKESQPARIFLINQFSRRWAAAAAILFLLVSSIWLLMNQTKNQNGTIANKPTVIQEEKNPSLQNIPNNSAGNQQQIAQQKEEPVQPVVAVEEKNNSKVKLIKQNAIAATNNPVNNENLNNTKQPTQQETLIAKNETQANTQTQNNSTQASNISTTPTVTQETNTTKTYSYASYNNDENAEEETIFLNEDRQRRSGLKGWVKKAKRIIERKAGMQSTDSEVRFAVFAINTQ